MRELMRILTLGTALSLASLLSTVAQAGDDWTGGYVGVQLGYADGDSDYVVPSFATTIPLSPSGATYGGLAGYDFQYGSVVIGLAGDFSGSNIDDSVTPTGGPFVDQTFSMQIDWIASLRGRIGFAASEDLLIYATGGWAAAGVEHANDSRTAFGFFIPVGLFQLNDNFYGWTAGGGVEYALTKNLVAGLEYRRTDLGSKSYSSIQRTFQTAAAAGTITLSPHTFDVELDEIRGSIRWKF